MECVDKLRYRNITMMMNESTH